MPRFFVLLVGLLPFVLLADGPAGISRSETAVDHVPQQLLVKFKSGVDTGRVTAENDASLMRVISPVNVQVLHVDDELQALARFARLPEVEYAELNAIYRLEVVPNDPRYSEQWALPKVSAPAAWDIEDGNINTVIAVVDSGIDIGHPDLSPNYISGGYDWVRSDSVPNDEKGHGTHVAGIAAARPNNSTGIAGMCWYCRIIAEKVCDAGSPSACFADRIASGIFHAVDLGADIINLSLGGPKYNATVESAANYAYLAGTIVLAAVGNTSSEVVQYPAAYLHAMGVSCTDQSDALCSSSSFGPAVEVSASGKDILSTAWRTSQCGDGICDPSGYKSASGTSMATPLVSGIAGLIRSLHPEYSADRVWGLLQQAVDDKGAAGWDKQFGAGRTNAQKGVSQAAPTGRLFYQGIVKWADVQCDRDVDPSDALMIDRYLQGLSVTQTDPCPNVNTSVPSAWCDVSELCETTAVLRFADVDCNGVINSTDSSKILQWDAGNPVSQTEPCPALEVPWVSVGNFTP